MSESSSFCVGLLDGWGGEAAPSVLRFDELADVVCRDVEGSDFGRVPGGLVLGRLESACRGGGRGAG